MADHRATMKIKYGQHECKCILLGHVPLNMLWWFLQVGRLAVRVGKAGKGCQSGKVSLRAKARKSKVEFYDGFWNTEKRK